MPGVIAHGTTARSGLATAIRDLIDAGSGPGKVRVQTSSGLVLGEVVLNKPCGTVAGSTLTLDVSGDLADVSADNDGTVAKAEVTDSDNTIIFMGSAGITGSGNAFELDTVTITAGDTIPLKTASYTAAI